MDRLELETQAWRNFNAYLANDGISTVIYKQKRRDWMQAQVVVTTIQSLAARNRFLHEFAPTDFQLIISDEAHRTISGNNRAGSLTADWERFFEVLPHGHRGGTGAGLKGKGRSWNCDIVPLIGLIWPASNIARFLNLQSK